MSTLFKEKVIKNLEAYNKSKLKNNEAGEYLHNGKVYSKYHILPVHMADKNIIAPYDSDLRTSDYLKDIKRHRYFHHLNSSQAMCINFFYPLIKEKQLELVLRALNISGQVNYSTVKFEKESELELVKDRKTNFDFYLETDEKTKVFFEIKYTEDNFGKAKNDEDHAEKFARTYAPILNDCDSITKDFKSQEKFLNNYQIMRNLIHINKNSYVVFIYPKENSVISKQAQDAKENMLNTAWKHHFLPCTWEQVSELVLSYMSTNKLKKYYEQEF